MESDSNEDWEFIYSELKRKVDYQIEAHRRFENQASRLLRIILTAISVTIGVVSSMVSMGGNIYVSDNVFRIEHLSSQIHQLKLVKIGEPQATLIAVLLTLSIVILFTISALHLFIGVPVNAYRVMNPSTLTPSLEGRDVLGENFSPISDRQKRRQVISKYREVIGENEAILDEAKTNWTNCYESLKIGISAFTTSGIIFAFSFVLYHAQLASLSLLFLLMIFVAHLIKNYSIEQISEYLFVRWMLDIPVFSSVVFIVLGLDQPIQMLTAGNPLERIAALSMVAMTGMGVYSGVVMELEKLKKIILRSASLFFISASLFFIILIGFPNTLGDLLGAVLVLGFMWGLGYLGASIILLMVLTARIGGRRIEEILLEGILNRLEWDETLPKRYSEKK